MGGVTKKSVVNFFKSAAFNFASELLGTAVLLFVGCLSTVVGVGNIPTDIGTSLCFALALFVAIEIAIHVSGGHVNPSLTVAAMVCRKVSIPMGFVYIVAQFLGGIIGYGLVISVNPSHGTNLIQENGACVVSPSSRITIVQAFFTEFFASSVFVLLFCSQIDPRNESLASVAMKIGLTVFPLAYAAGAYSGVSLNPARAFGPAVWNNSWESHWIYWVAPFSAALIWSAFYFYVFLRLHEKMKEKENEE